VSFLSDMKEFNDDVDSITRRYLDMQIVAMMLYHAGCVRIQEGDPANGELIIEVAQHARESLADLKATFETSFGKDDMYKAFKRVGYAKLLFSSLSDGVLRNNHPYFDLPQRPPGAEYACDDAACDERIGGLLHEYFPSLED
jgi:hypothetical protein